MPLSIEQYSRVIHFPYEAELVKLVGKVPEFRQAIEYLCAFNNPAPDKIECVATVLLGAWASRDKSQTSVMEILRKAQESTPSFIRSFNQELQLDPEISEILGKIPDFKYNLSKGFLHWEYREGLEEGTLSYSLETDRFRQFQKLVKKNNPTCFEELEGFLI